MKSQCQMYPKFNLGIKINIKCLEGYGLGCVGLRLGKLNSAPYTTKLKPSNRKAFLKPPLRLSQRMKLCVSEL
jgi:hypothetical protein